MQTISRAFKKCFFSRSGHVFWVFLWTKTVFSLVFLIFRECQPWIVHSMFLNFWQISVLCSNKIVLIKKCIAFLSSHYWKPTFYNTIEAKFELSHTCSTPSVVEGVTIWHHGDWDFLQKESIICLIYDYVNIEDIIRLFTTFRITFLCTDGKHWINAWNKGKKKITCERLIWY